MKRRDLIRHLEKHDCALLREGGKHSVYYHQANLATSAVSRHREINYRLAEKICKDLGIAKPDNKS